MARCSICGPGALGDRSAVWAWQPFGPDERVAAFTVAGSHYRGFPAIKVCSFCREDLVQGCRRGFTYRGERFVADTCANTVTHLATAS
jgi:hypothetical protein